MLDLISEYADLINVALLCIVIGWLFHISRLSRVALQDKFDAQLAAKQTEIASLTNRLEDLGLHHSSELSALEHKLSIFEKIASLPQDQAVEALKADMSTD